MLEKSCLGFQCPCAIVFLSIGSSFVFQVDFNEPLSFLQRLTEDLEYAALLDHAAELTDSCEQMCYVAAYAVSCYATTGTRTTKPFNPLLGETYECDRTSDLGWWSMAEQVDTCRFLLTYLGLSSPPDDCSSRYTASLKSLSTFLIFSGRKELDHVSGLHNDFSFPR